MKIINDSIFFTSSMQIEFIDLTDEINSIMTTSGIANGLLTVSSPETTVGVVVNYNEPLLIQDFIHTLHRLIPIDIQYSHDLFELRRTLHSDGRSNGHSHCKALILPHSETFSVCNNTLILGKKQNIFAVELDGARERQITVSIIGL